MYVVLIGRPGVGKGTQAQRLGDALGLPPISTGEILREIIRSHGDQAQEIANRIDGGNLAADELIMELVEHELEESGFEAGCLFDGIPRTIVQARALDDLLGRRGEQIRVAIEMAAPVESLVGRILARAGTEGRADDTLPAIRQRMEIYNQRTEPILRYYQKQGVLRSIDGLGTREEVFHRLRRCIEDC